MPFMFIVSTTHVWTMVFVISYHVNLLSQFNILSVEEKPQTEIYLGTVFHRFIMKVPSSLFTLIVLCHQELMM